MSICTYPIQTEIHLPIYASPSMNQSRRHQAALLGLERFADAGWSIEIRRPAFAVYEAKAERMHGGSLQFVQDTGVYVTDAVERIVEKMAKESEVAR